MLGYFSREEMLVIRTINKDGEETIYGMYDTYNDAELVKDKINELNCGIECRILIWSVKKMNKYKCFKNKREIEILIE